LETEKVGLFFIFFLFFPLFFLLFFLLFYTSFILISQLYAREEGNKKKKDGEINETN